VTTGAPLHTLIQITDPHLTPEGSLLRGRIDTAAPFERALATVTASGVTAGALLLTGDLADAGDAPTYRRLRALVDPLGIPVVPVAGNHDDRAGIRVHLMDRPADPSGPDRTPLDHVVRIGGLRVVVLDTTVPGHGHGELRRAQVEWLAAELAEPAPDGTVLALHHPPLPTPNRLSRLIELRGREALAPVLAGSDVRIVLAGHTHVVSAGAIAGVPVWTGGGTAYGSDGLAPDRGERVLLAPGLSRIDLFTDSVIVTAIPVDPVVALTLSGAQVDAMAARA
jgi:3',5'-cyclic AMP phosphodiesterase CpdA